MTPFMLRIAQLVGADEADVDDAGIEATAPKPLTRISRRIATSTSPDSRALPRRPRAGRPAR